MQLVLQVQALQWQLFACCGIESGYRWWFHAGSWIHRILLVLMVA
jgi:hypothetical protein